MNPGNTSTPRPTSPISNEACWRSLVDSGIVAVAVLQHDRVIEANDAFLRLVGYTREEIETGNVAWRPLMAPESLARSDAACAKRRAGGRCASFETQYLRKDGTRAWAMTAFATIREGEDQWMALALDISDRKHAAAEREAALEREHAARRRAEDAARLKDEFLANLSHELRTPMNAIIGWTHLLCSGRLEEAQRRRALESIDRGARAQAKLIEDLLDVSRIVSGKLSLTLQPVDLTAIVDAALESQRPAAQVKGLQLARGLAPQEFVVLGDAGRLQQAFLNILSNAVKFTPAPGRVDITLTRTNDDAEVAVADTGEGISPEFLPHVFERFRQADGTGAGTHTGLGLGLAIVRHLVELHGGTVRAASEGGGKGTTFTVTIPLATGVEGRPRRPMPERMPGNYGPPGGLGVRVLVVEDDPETREILGAILERSGFSYRLASRASEALSMLEEWLPDAIVSDIGMAEMDGYAFMRELRSRPRQLGGLIPALALTAYARGADRELALRSGYQAHVVKPVDPVDLVRAITGLTGHPVSHGDAQM